MFHNRLFIFTCLLGLLLVIDPSSADDTPTFHTSATVVAVNAPFNATCTLASPPSTGSYLVTIERGGQTVVDYLVPAINPDNSATRVPKVAITTSYFNGDFTIRPLAANSTHFTVSLTHHTLGRFTYACSSEYTGSRSTEVHLTVVNRTTYASISANVSNPLVGVPFTLTCSLSGFTPLPEDNYTVAFYSQRNAYLGGYEIEAAWISPIFSVLEHEHIFLSRGPREAFPHFDLTLTESKDLTQEYWCSVQLPGQPEVPSAHWGTGLTTLTFTTAKGPQATTRSASCKLNNFLPKGNAYLVDFFAEQAPKGTYRLGGYKVDANGLHDFSGAKFDAGSSYAVHGTSHAYPSFDILAYLAQDSATMNAAWWCTLTVGTPGSSDYHLYSSQKATIA